MGYSDKKKKKKMNEIVIGSGEKLYSAVKVFALQGEHNIAQNKNAFWISNAGMFNVSLKIFKDTPEGVVLGCLITENASIERIERWIDMIVLANIDVDIARNKIESVKNQWFKKGQLHQQEAMRAVLGFND